jgi:hypothetical protein
VPVIAEVTLNSASRIASGSGWRSFNTSQITMVALARAMMARNACIWLSPLMPRVLPRASWMKRIKGSAASHMKRTATYWADGLKFSNPLSWVP